MKKNIIVEIFACFVFSCAFAGDAAFFVDTGFSSDGSVYIFGQYGQTDKTYRGWAEIYTVDVKANRYVSGGVFAASPSAATAQRHGKDVYGALAKTNDASINKYNCRPAPAEQVLFINGDESKPGTDEIVFKDFGTSPVEAQDTYHVQLVPTVKGKGADVSSSFFIMLEKHGADGKVLGRQKIGTPDFVRKGVAGYKIQKIFCDKSGKSIVFVVEKTVHDATGISLRYMVETASLEDSLRVAVK